MMWNTRVPTLGPESAYIFRITHVDNVAWMLRNGLRCATSKTLDPDFVPIGMEELIKKRRLFTVPIEPGGTLGDYVPFYFTPHSPMLLNIKTGRHGVIRRPNSEIAIIVSSLHRLSRMGKRFVFTNAHACSNEADFFSDLKDLEKLDWDLLRARDFRGDAEDPGKVSRYMAEALVHRKVPIDGLLGIACSEQSVATTLSTAVEEAGVSTPIKVLPGWYF